MSKNFLLAAAALVALAGCASNPPPPPPAPVAEAPPPPPPAPTTHTVNYACDKGHTPLTAVFTDASDSSPGSVDLTMGSTTMTATRHGTRGMVYGGKGVSFSVKAHTASLTTGRRHHTCIEQQG